MINGLIFEYGLFDSMIQLDKYTFSIEKCECIIDFLLLSRRNFLIEAHLKKKLFGRSFENMDCPSLTGCFACRITLSQTFNDDFVFVSRIANNILFSHLHYDYMRLVDTVIPPCELSRIRLMMMSFIHKEIMTCGDFKRFVNESELHDIIGTKIFFHDSIIERWRRLIEFDVILEKLEGFRDRERPSTIENLRSYKENILVIFDKEHVNIYAYDGGFLRPSFRRS